MEDLIKNLSLAFALAFGFALIGSLFCLRDYKQENMMLKKKLVEAGMARYDINDKGELVFLFKDKDKEVKK